MGLVTAVFSSIERMEAPNTLRDTSPQKSAWRTRIRGLQHAVGIRQSLSMIPQQFLAGGATSGLQLAITRIL